MPPILLNDRRSEKVDSRCRGFQLRSSSGWLEAQGGMVTVALGLSTAVLTGMLEPLCLQAPVLAATVLDQSPCQILRARRGDGCFAAEPLLVAVASLSEDGV